MKTLNLTPTVSSAGIMRVLPDMFSSRDTFLKELAQNANRAKATSIHIDYDEQLHQLTFKDNGIGFSETSWEKFFITADSGWDEDTMKTELPFGIGAASCVFSSKKVTISSKGYVAEFDDSFYTDSKAVEIKPTRNYIEGTEIILRLKDEIIVNSHIIGRIYQYFSLHVYFNKEEIVCHKSIDNGWDTVEYEKFSISFPPIKTIASTYKYRERLVELGYDLELQGFKIDTDNRWSSPIIVRLKSFYFRSRVPDREVLVDSFSESHVEVTSCIKEYMHMKLSLLNKNTTPSEFSNQYWDLATVYSPDILKDKPIPECYVYRFDSLPFKHASHESLIEDVEIEGGLLFEENVVNKIHMLRGDVCSFEAHECSDQEEIIYSAYCNGLSITGNWFIQADEIPDGHWVFNHISDFSEVFDPTETELIKQVVNEDSFYVSELGVTVAICDKVDITLNCNGEAYKYSIDDCPASVDNILYLPNANTKNVSDAIRQLAYRTTGDEYYWAIDEDWLNTSENKLNDLVNARLASHPADVIQRVLELQKALLRESGHFEQAQTFSISIENSELVSITTL